MSAHIEAGNRLDRPKRGLPTAPFVKIALLLLVSLAVRLALAPVMMNYHDCKNYISSAHKSVRYGVASTYDQLSDNHVYHGQDNVPLTYPPIHIYLYAIAGALYQNLFDSDFRDISAWRQLPFRSVSMNSLIKAPLIVFDLVLALVIFAWVRKEMGDQRALLCAALYALNPAILYGGALWAQPDAVHCAFLTLAVVFLAKAKPAACACFLTLAVLTKPQPVIFVPVIVLLIVTRSNLRQIALAGLAAGATAIAVLAPMILNGPGPIVRMVEAISTADTYVSVNAHNFWWLALSVLRLSPKETPDSTVAFAGITYFALGVSLVLLFYVLAAARLLKTDNNSLIIETCAYLGWVFFTFSPRMHENHAIQVLPLLLLTGLKLRRQRVIFALISLTILINMAAHSPEIVSDLSSVLVERIRKVNAAVNVAVFVYWAYKINRHPAKVIVAPAGSMEPTLAAAESGSS